MIHLREFHDFRIKFALGGVPPLCYEICVCLLELALDKALPLRRQPLVDDGLLGDYVGDGKLMSSKLHLFYFC